MTEIQQAAAFSGTPSIFNFDQHTVRIVMRDGEPWFVGKDVALTLGYADTTNAMKRHCRGVAKRHPIADSLGRKQEARILGEPDVLRLIVNSNLPAAERFEKWVFEEVLPSIRKTGAYAPATRAVPPAPTLPASLGRWILGFDGRGKPHMTQLDAKEAVINPARLPEIINAPDSVFDDTLLLTRIAGACLGRLMPIAPDPDDYAPQAPIPPDVQAALDCKAWTLAAEAHKIIHRHLRISVDISCAIGHPERYIDQPKAMGVIAKTILDDALTPHNSALILMEHMADHIAESAKNYAEAVKAGTSALRKRGVVLGPVLKAAKGVAHG